jgi:hypothetical protein
MLVEEGTDRKTLEKLPYAGQEPCGSPQPPSPQKHRLRVPLQRLPVRLADWVAGHPDALAVEGHVGLAVVEVVLQAAADEEAAVGGDSDVALVVEAVDVGAEEEAVVEAVLASLADREDVGGVQDRQRLLSGHRAATLVAVRHQHAESALAQPATDGDGISVDPRQLLCRDLRRDGDPLGDPLEARGNLIPQAPAGGRLRVVALLRDVRREVRRGWNPQRLVEEERVPEQDAADRVVGADRVAAVLLDPAPHLVLCRGPVLLTEGFPDEAPRKEEEVDEEATTDDVVLRVVQLEEQRLTRDAAEGLLASRFPEVHLIHVRQVPQESEPVVVGHGYS